MYIRIEGDEHLLVKNVEGIDGTPSERILAKLGSDPELNLFFAAQQSRRNHPDLWENVSDYHLLQALENYKRRLGGQKPALVCVEGKIQSDEKGD